MLCTTFVISKHLFKQNNSSSWRSLFISVFGQLWHTNINLRYFFIFNFYQNYTGGGFFVDLKHQRSLLLWVRTQNGYSFCGFEPTTFGLWARRATELLYPAIYNSAVFYSFIIIALCKGCVNSFLHIFLFYALPGFFDWIYLHFNLSFLRVCTQLYGGTDANKRFKYLLKQKWDCAK